MNLKQMIEEAKMLAESPGQSLEDLREQREARTPVRETERSRSRKSESVVSVIEAVHPTEDTEPTPMSRRGVPVKRSPIAPRIEDPVPVARSPLRQRVEQEQEQELAPPPPLEEMALPPPPSAPSRSSQKSTPQPPGSRRAVNREPSVGSDRYEEIIVETRKRSQSRSRMGSRTSSVVDFKTSNASLANAKNISALDLDTKNVTPRQSIVPEPVKKASVSSIKTPAGEVTRRPAAETPAVPSVSRKPQIVAMDANGNATTPSLPTVPQAPQTPRRQGRPGTPDPLVKLFPKNIPDWFMITYTYSVVLIFILLIANVTPDGKLYIHFTAFWSLIIYFVLEDDQVTLNMI